MDTTLIKSRLNNHPIAYFCAEFALSDNLPIYSGGLGILAGDVVREANDLKLPFVAIGLLYKHGFFRQAIEDGNQKEYYDQIDTNQPELQLIKRPDGSNLVIEIPIASDTLYIQVWQYTVGTTAVFLLDTDLDQNKAEYRTITDGLYRGNRILQEIVLGIGGERALYAMDIHPSIYHLNEGHSAFAIFEIAHHYLKEKGMTFAEGFQLAKHQIFFTNHTLVPAGNDVFIKEELKPYLSSYADQLQLPLDIMLTQGDLPHDPTKFGMTMLALSMATKVNAVSTLHSIAAKKLWPNEELVPITNGVHLPTWVADPIKQASHDFDLDVLHGLSNDLLWQIHKINKQKLIDTIERTVGVQFDLEVLTLVWARRFASYKQPALLFSEIETLKRIAKSAQGALQIVIAGKAHPHDDVGKGMIADIMVKIQENHLHNTVVYIPNYSMTVAKTLTQGADLWLNTPIRGEEASGTSGMKSGANGALQFSTSDGWVDEVNWEGTGWIIDPEHMARSLYETLESTILPTYYTVDDHYISQEWVNRMKKTMHIIWQKYSATRMLKDYIETFYLPALHIIDNDIHSQASE